MPQVGVNNHRQFMVFVITLIIGVFAFDSLTIGCKAIFLSLGAALNVRRIRRHRPTTTILHGGRHKLAVRLSS